MQRWIPVLAVVLVLQLALAVGLALGGGGLAAQKPDMPLVEADIKASDRLVIEGPASDVQSADQSAANTTSVELKKQDGQWVLPDYYDAPADVSRVQGMLDKLVDLKRGYAVATTAGALKRFQVADDSFERRVVVQQGDETLATLYLGSSPGLRKIHARTAADEAVYAVELTAYELPIQAMEWLDNALLKVDADALQAIEMKPDGQGGLKLVRHAKNGDGQAQDGWRAEGLAEGEQLDSERAQILVRAIRELRVDGVLGIDAQPEWQQDQPLLTLSLQQRDGQAIVWTLSQPEGKERYVLKASNQPWYLELEEWNAKPLLEAAAQDKLVVADKSAPAQQPDPEAGSQEPGAQSTEDPSSPALPDTPSASDTLQDTD